VDGAAWVDEVRAVTTDGSVGRSESAPRAVRPTQLISPASDSTHWTAIPVS